MLDRAYEMRAENLDQPIERHLAPAQVDLHFGGVILDDLARHRIGHDDGQNCFAVVATQPPALFSVIECFVGALDRQPAGFQRRAAVQTVGGAGSERGLPRPGRARLRA